MQIRKRQSVRIASFANPHRRKKDGPTRWDVTRLRELLPRARLTHPAQNPHQYSKPAPIIVDTVRSKSSPSRGITVDLADAGFGRCECEIHCVDPPSVQGFDSQSAEHGGRKAKGWTGRCK